MYTVDLWIRKVVDVVLVEPGRGGGMTWTVSAKIEMRGSEIWRPLPSNWMTESNNNKTQTKLQIPTYIHALGDRL